MDIAIREARCDDAEAVVGILNPIIEAGEYTVLDGPLSVEAERRFIASLAGSRLYEVMWMPQLPGGFLFALGFLPLARATRQEG
jgi:L-amino acid N-acyltransferase YncA